MCPEVWAENTVHQHIVYIGFDMKGPDILCSAAADIQINKFIGAFHVTRLGMTHADATCSYSSSWETLIFNTFGLYSSFKLSSALQFLLILTIVQFCVKHFLGDFSWI